MTKLDTSAIAKGKFTAEETAQILGSQGNHRTPMQAFGYMRGLAAICQIGDGEVQVRTPAQAQLAPNQDAQQGPLTVGYGPHGTLIESVGRDVSDTIAKALVGPAKADDYSPRHTRRVQFLVDRTAQHFLTHCDQRGVNVHRVKKVDGQAVRSFLTGYSVDGTPVMIAETPKGLYKATNFGAWLEGDDEVIKTEKIGSFDRITAIGSQLFQGSKGMAVITTDKANNQLMVGKPGDKPVGLQLNDAPLLGFALAQSYDVNDRRYQRAIVVSPEANAICQVTQQPDGSYTTTQICSLEGPAWEQLNQLLKGGKELQGVVSDNALIFNAIDASQNDVVVPFSWLNRQAQQLLWDA